MKEDLTHPHDALFKRVFAVPEHAASELRAVLPTDVAQRVDWSTQSPLSGTMVEEDLRGRASDLIFQVEYAGADALVYLLFEHQSSQDPMMGYRMLRYMAALWDTWRSKHKKARRLPVILPVVMYHGRKPWKAPRSFHDLLTEAEGSLGELAPFVPSFSYIVDDLAAQPTEVLLERKAAAAVQVALLCLKRARESADFVGELERVEPIMRELMAAPNGLAAFSVVMRYTSVVAETTAERLEAYARALGAEALEAYMTGAQQLMDEGAMRGRVAEAVEAVRRVLAARSLQLSEFGERRLSEMTDLDELRRLHERAIVVEAADDIFS